MKRHGGDAKALVEQMTDLTVGAMYASSEENKFIEVTYANGEKEVLYFKDFASGALIEGIVSRAKKFAVKRAIAKEGRGLRSEDLIRAIREEFKEHEDLPNTTNPDDWAKISGKKATYRMRVGSTSRYEYVLLNHARSDATVTPTCSSTCHWAEGVVVDRLVDRRGSGASRSSCCEED